MMKMALLCSLISMLFIASSSAFVLEHNALQRTKRLQLNLKRTVSKQISFKKAVTPKHVAPPSTDDDDNIYHRRIVHFEHHKKNEEEEDGSKHSNRSFKGWDHRDFAKTIDP